MIRIMTISFAVLLTASSARANFGMFYRPVPVQTRSYYYLVPVVVTQVPMPYVAAPCPEPIFVPPTVPNAEAAVPNAPPQSAPPSTGPLRPTPSTKPLSSPGVKDESSKSAKVATSYYESYPTANAKPSRTRGQYVVTFWNLSGTCLSLRVAGQVRELNQGQSLALDLSREFEWRVEGREAQSGRVPDGETGLTLLIRR